MLAQLGCAEEDAEVDLELGYPPVYAKLCRHEDAAGLPIPFMQAPPHRFLPYAPHAEDFLHLQDWDSLFPVVAEKEKDSSCLRTFGEELWQQLDHLGNAGFDPSKFRVDPYGNVVYWNADPASPLAWDIDHWFPSSRGGKAEVPNLRIVQWQAFLRKRNRLEFLVPWWDLQHGCSINQFLSAFAAKNSDFRRRSLALFFVGGEDEAVAKEHVGDNRPWPLKFQEKKALCGLAAAAIVTRSLDNDASDAYPLAIFGPASKRHWTLEEEQAFQEGISSWNDFKAHDSTVADGTAAHMKEKVLRGVARNNFCTFSTSTSRSDLAGRQSAATTALQKALRVKIAREGEKQEREDELAQLEATVTKLKVENEKERMKAAQLESLLKKRKHRVEKHRKVAESQASYRLCLERVLRDTGHESMTYKEQALLSQEACNVLIARLDSEKALCEAMEGELLQRHSARETLAVVAAAAAGASPTQLKKMKEMKNVVLRGRDLVDVSSCVSLREMEADDYCDYKNDDDNNDNNRNMLAELSHETEEDCEDYTLRREHQRKSLVRHAIKEYMQQSRATVRKSRETSNSLHQEYNIYSETSESSSDSEFADDEMSPQFHITKETSCNNSGDNQSVRELQNLRTRKSKPDDADGGATTDTPTPSAGETSRSESKREVQKDVISECPTKPPGTRCDRAIDEANVYKQAYLDELLRHIRFHIPTPEVERCTIEAHVDELLDQVLTTHVENLRKTKPSGNPDADADLKSDGKSNLDKWVQALLMKGGSPFEHVLLPAVSQLSAAAIRDSLERTQNQVPRKPL